MSINFEPKREEMKSTRSKNSKFEELVPDEKMRDRIMSHLKTKGPLFGEGSVYLVNFCNRRLIRCLKGRLKTSC